MIEPGFVAGGCSAAITPRPRPSLAGPSRRVFLIVASLLLCPLLDPLLAQGEGFVAGTVTGPNNTPLENARIKVLGTDLKTESKSDGTYRLAGVSEGHHTLEIRALGYTTGKLPFDVQKGGSVELAVSLATAAVALDTVKVSAMDGLTPAMRGFEERRHRGVGKFFTRADIAKMQARNFTDILRRVPGMQIQTVSSVFGSSDAVRSPRIAGGIANRTCPMMFYINGAPFPMNQDYTINQFVSTEDVAAVEVYSGSSEIPPQFNSAMASAPCGVVLIWIRDGKNEPTPGR